MILLSLVYFIYFVHGILCEVRMIPQIIEHIETAVIADKGTAYLNCTMVLTEDMFMRARWYSIDDNQYISTGTKVELSQRQDSLGNDKYEVYFNQRRSSYVPIMPGQSSQVWTYQLVIRKFIDSYSKNYKCEIDLSGFPMSEKPVAIGKVVLQKAPYIEPMASTIVNEGMKLQLTCNAKGSPTPRISWIKANGEAFPLDGAPQRITSSNLIVSKVGRYDRGMYRCHAQNNVGKADEYDVMVEVSFPPTVRFARRSGAYAQMANQNYEIMMECIVNGYPDPDLYWYRGVYHPNRTNELITNGVRYFTEKIVSYGTVGTNITDVFFVLRILNVMENDFGKYTCLARNKMGYDQKVISMFKQQVCQGALCSILPGSRNHGSSLVRDGLFSPARLFVIAILVSMATRLLGTTSLTN